MRISLSFFFKSLFARNGKKKYVQIMLQLDSLKKRSLSVVFAQTGTKANLPFFFNTASLNVCVCVCAFAYASETVCTNA